jgi:hypothetical protein
VSRPQCFQSIDQQKNNKKKSIVTQEEEQQQHQEWPTDIRKTGVTNGTPNKQRRRPRRNNIDNDRQQQEFHQSVSPDWTVHQ